MVRQSMASPSAAAGISCLGRLMRGARQIKNHLASHFEGGSSLGPIAYSL